MINLDSIVGYKPEGIEYHVVAIHPDVYAMHQHLEEIMEKYGVTTTEQFLIKIDEVLAQAHETHYNPFRN